MANREALRELQSRLAQRMQAAQTETRGNAWLAVEVAGLGLLIPLHQAGEIFPLAGVLAVPHTRPWFMGVANLRGALVSVVDLARFLGLRHEQRVPESAHDHMRLLALGSALGVNCALMVDRMSGLRNSEQLSREPEDGVHRPSFAAARWRDAEGSQWLELDLPALAAHPRFLNVAA